MDESKEFEQEARQILQNPVQLILKDGVISQGAINQLVEAHHKATQERVRAAIYEYSMLSPYEQELMLREILIIKRKDVELANLEQPK